MTALDWYIVGTIFFAAFCLWICCQAEHVRRSIRSAAVDDEFAPDD